MKNCRQMIKDLLRLALLMAVLILIQVLVLNQLQFSGFINPYMYILFILILPVGLNRAAVLLLSFVLGLSIDLFSNTPGMHAAACVWMAFFRPTILELLSTREAYQEQSWPTLSAFGTLWYLRYTVFMILIHHVFLFLVEQFDHMHFWAVLLRIVLSSVATLVFIFLAQFFLPTQTDRR